MFKYIDITTEGYDPFIDEVNIYPSVLKFVNFKEQQLNFSNYYISISNIENNNCNDNNYLFYLNSTFKSDNVQSNEQFSIDLDYKENKTKAYCSFPDEIIIGKSGNIKCIIKEPINGNLKLELNNLYLQEKNKYIINLGDNHYFEMNNIECPYISYNNDASEDITPDKSKNNSLNFGLSFNTSYSPQKEIKILYYNHTEKKDNILEFNIIPSQNNTINNFIDCRYYFCRNYYCFSFNLFLLFYKSRKWE